MFQRRSRRPISGQAVDLFEIPVGSGKVSRARRGVVGRFGLFPGSFLALDKVVEFIEFGHARAPGTGKRERCSVSQSPPCRWLVTAMFGALD